MTQDWTPAGLEEWQTRDELPGVAEGVVDQVQYRPPFTDELAGTTAVLVHEDGRRLTVEFVDKHTLRRTFEGGETVEVEYDATPVRDGIYLVDYIDPSWPVDDAVALYPRNVTWAYDKARGIVTIALSRIVSEAARAESAVILRGRTTHEHWNVEGSTGTHPRSDGMAGHRVLWRYSDTDEYDHVYLNGANFAWQCARGREKGLTELDRTRAYEVGDGLFFFHWAENFLIVESALFVDLRDLLTHGRFFGIEADGTVARHRFGARGELLSKIDPPTP